MNKRYLPAIASLLIIVTISSFVPVFAQLPTYLTAQPTLTVKTIAEDDMSMKTGVIWMAEAPGPLLTGATPLYQDLLAQFKVLVSYNGVPITPSSTYCQFVEKDKYNPLKNKQFAAENLYTYPKDNPNFVCKFRWGKPGVGVIDVYYIGALAGQYIADYILVVGAAYAVGHTTVWGTEIQDICVLGWPMVTAPAISFTKGNGDKHLIVADALGPFVSCEDAALIQKNVLGIGIPWT